MAADDPTAWLGDPVAVIATAKATVYLHVPPERPHELVVSLLDAPTLEDPNARVESYAQLSLSGARGLLEGLGRAIAVLEEHV